ncbi:hypothetical protein TrRE_jg4782 [Triparma retinervis]|uniref:Uncharacterized protein n=1 Tax=Triparma retinervis TaxID=2557542 RepID=A0A9W7DPR0_9STRA|nr:hypothetical protein TrRE_jg4782 [Triparma retinervis]
MNTIDTSLNHTTEISDFIMGVIFIVCASKLQLNLLDLQNDADRFGKEGSPAESTEPCEFATERKIVSWFSGSDGVNSHVSNGRLKRASILILARRGGVESYDIEVGVEGEGEGEGDYRFSEVGGDDDVGSEALLSSLEEHFINPPSEAQGLVPPAQEEERFLSMELELRRSPTEPPSPPAASSFTAPTPYPSVHHPLTPHTSPVPQSPTPRTVVFGKFTTPRKQVVTLSTTTFSPQSCQPVIFGTLPPPSPDPPQAGFSQNTATSLKTFGSEETKTIVVQTPGTKEGGRTGVACHSLLDMFK